MWWLTNPNGGLQQHDIEAMQSRDAAKPLHLQSGCLDFFATLKLAILFPYTFPSAFVTALSRCRGATRASLAPTIFLSGIVVGSATVMGTRAMVPILLMEILGSVAAVQTEVSQPSPFIYTWSI
jgi:hypothetical protein